MLTPKCSVTLSKIAQGLIIEGMNLDEKLLKRMIKEYVQETSSPSTPPQRLNSKVSSMVDLLDKRGMSWKTFMLLIEVLSFDEAKITIAGTTTINGKKKKVNYTTEFYVSDGQQLRRESKENTK